VVSISIKSNVAWAIISKVLNGKRFAAKAIFLAGKLRENFGNRMEINI
jgi:hypothetical protein